MLCISGGGWCKLGCGSVRGSCQSSPARVDWWSERNDHHWWPGKDREGAYGLAVWIHQDQTWRWPTDGQQRSQRVGYGGWTLGDQVQGTTCLSWASVWSEHSYTGRYSSDSWRVTKKVNCFYSQHCSSFERTGSVWLTRSFATFQPNKMSCRGNVKIGVSLLTVLLLTSLLLCVSLEHCKNIFCN